MAKIRRSSLKELVSKNSGYILLILGIILTFFSISYRTYRSRVLSFKGNITETVIKQYAKPIRIEIPDLKIDLPVEEGGDDVQAHAGQPDRHADDLGVRQVHRQEIQAHTRDRQQDPQPLERGGAFPEQEDASDGYKHRGQIEQQADHVGRQVFQGQEQKPLGEGVKDQPQQG